jgi:hypothetical protein
MKRTQFSEAQIAFVLKQAEDGTPNGNKVPISLTNRSGTHGPPWPAEAG